MTSFIPLKEAVTSKSTHKHPIMKKSFCLLVLMMMMGPGLMAQNTKTTIGLLPFHTDFNYSPEYINQISEVVSQAFVTSGRFRLFDPDRLQQALLDSNLMNTPVDPASANSYRNVGKLLGVQYIVYGNVRNISTKTATSLTGGPAFTGHVIFTLKIVNVETGEIGELREFDSYGAIGGYINMSYETDHNALLKTIQGMRRPVEKFIEESFPLTFPVTAILEEKGGEALMLEILGGKSMGLDKGMKLTVYEISYREYDGRQVKKTRIIGEIKITEVQGDDISEAKVSEGGKEILRAYQANPKSILCTAH
jgi:hypothetical protein